MERRKPRHYWPFCFAAIAVGVTGVTGMTQSLQAGAWRAVPLDLAWTLAGLLLMLAAEARDETTRGRLAWIRVVAVAVIASCLAGRLLVSS